MGVQNFFKITNEQGEVLEEIGETQKISNLAGSRVSIDASNIIYSSLLALSSVHSLTDSEGNPTGHIQRILQMVQQYHKEGVHQVWVFDSPNPNKLKRKELERRKKRREEAAQKGYKNAEKINFKLTGKHVEDIQQLLALMGISYIVAPDGVEAEQYGAMMTTGENPFCAFMVSGDSDVILFGGNLLRIVSEKSATGKTKKTVYKEYMLSDVLKFLGVTYSQLLKIAVCLGTDFQSEKIKGIGPKTVVKKVKSGNVAYTEEHEEVIDYYQSVTENLSDINTSELNVEGLTKFLLGKSFAESKIKTAIEVMSKKI